MTTPKEEMIRALAHEPALEQIPLWELEFHLWDRFSDKPFRMGEEFARLTAAEQRQAVETNAEVMAEVCDRLGFAALTIPGGYWEVAPGIPAYYWLPEQHRMELARLLEEEIGDRTLLIANTGGVMAIPDADRYVEFSYLLFDDPEQVDRMAQEKSDLGMRSMERFADLGYRCALAAADLADSHGPYFSPEQMDRYIYPYLRRFAEHAASLGMYSILHSDGNITPFLDRIAECGIDAVQALDPIAGMEIVPTQRNFGDRLTVCGNIDCGLLLTAPPEEIYRSTHDLLLACRGQGSFALGASNAVQREVPPENYMALIKAHREYGKMKRERTFV